MAQSQQYSIHHFVYQYIRFNQSLASLSKDERLQFETNNTIPITHLFYLNIGDRIKKMVESFDKLTEYMRQKKISITSTSSFKIIPAPILEEVGSYLQWYDFQHCLKILSRRFYLIFNMVSELRMKPFIEYPDKYDSKYELRFILITFPQYWQHVRKLTIWCSDINRFINNKCDFKKVKQLEITSFLAKKDLDDNEISRIINHCSCAETELSLKYVTISILALKSILTHSKNIVSLHFEHVKLLYPAQWNMSSYITNKSNQNHTF